MTPYEIIARKRDGKSLSEEEIRYLVQGYLRGEVKDYQMSAFLMAVYLNGMDENETFALTKVYIESGKVVDLSHLSAPKIDKHSTGGVGDKVSIILAPLVASCGVIVPMMSGRGLGHTGGTLDKLESIPGFRTQLSIEEFVHLLEKNGLAMIGQTEELVPADKHIYALRDVTATVESIPLITASILSKKIAEGIDGLVLDVKVGNGAFMTDIHRARQLAQSLIRVGEAFGKKIKALLTSMDQPLGHYVGNWLEIRECLDCFHGKGPQDLMEITLQLAAHMVTMAQAAPSITQARKMLEEKLASGEAWEKFLQMVTAQGGKTDVLLDPARYPKVRFGKSLTADRDGYVHSMNTREIGLTAVILGAGRFKAEDEVDPQAGLILHKKIGDAVHPGDVIAEVFSNNAAALDEAVQRLQKAIHISSEPPEQQPLILEKMGS